MPVDSAAGTIGPASGIIEQPGAIDVFHFHPTQSRIKLRIATDSNGGMLSPSLSILVNGFGQIVPASIVTEGVTCTVTADNLSPADTYYLEVKGVVGVQGNIGTYTITGTQPTFAVIDHNRTLQITGVIGDNNINWHDQNGLLVIEDTYAGGAGSQTFNYADFDDVTIQLANRDDTVDIGSVGDGSPFSGYKPVTCLLGGGNDTLKLRGVPAKRL